MVKPGYACRKCRHYSCICTIEKIHKKNCAYRKSITCAIPVECEHGYSVCFDCDPCFCLPVHPLAHLRAK